VISQIYSVQNITIGKNRYIFGDDVECQMFVMDQYRALLQLTNPQRALDGILTFHQTVKPGILQHIEYTIIASVDGQTVKQQRYEHSFTTKAAVDRDGVIWSNPGALFIPYQLNVLLDSNKFGRAQSVQFIA